MSSPSRRDRIVLAYSGGLDTSVAIGWIAEQTGAEIIATYDEQDTFDPSLAKGFVELWGMPSKIAARRDLRLCGQRVAP